MVYNAPRSLCCEYLLDSRYHADSDKYPQTVFFLFFLKKSILSAILLLPVWILHNAKFFLKTKSYEQRLPLQRGCSVLIGITLGGLKKITIEFLLLPKLFVNQCVVHNFNFHYFRPTCVSLT